VIFIGGDQCWSPILCYGQQEIDNTTAIACATNPNEHTFSNRDLRSRKMKQSCAAHEAPGGRSKSNYGPFVLFVRVKCAKG
jgi:hypothetical protein